MNIFVLFVVRELPLNSLCSSDDVCADSNAACRNFRCLCLDDFFERYGVCSTQRACLKLTNVITSMFCVVRFSSQGPTQHTVLGRRRSLC